MAEKELMFGMKLYGEYAVGDITNPTTYIPACTTGGECHNPFPQWPRSKGTWPGHYVVFTNENGPNDYVPYSRCMGCGLPKTQSEAIRLNGECGLELPSVSDTLAKLKAMKERLGRNEGQSR